MIQCHNSQALWGNHRKTVARLGSLFRRRELEPLVAGGNPWLCAVSGILGKNVRQFIEQNTAVEICKQPLLEALRCQKSIQAPRCMSISRSTLI